MAYTKADTNYTKADVHSGPIHSSVAGRTDHLPMKVHSGSYVIPADIISAMGEGNTMAGFKVARRMFSSEPYGQNSLPYSQKKSGFDDQVYGAKGIAKAAGGAAHVPIVAAGGEYVLTPEDVIKIGEGNMNHGHEILDEFIKAMRAKTIKTLKKLPGPKKD